MLKKIAIVIKEIFCFVFEMLASVLVRNSFDSIYFDACLKIFKPLHSK